MYSEKLIDHFQNPRNVGELPNATARARVENPACGDVMDIYLMVRDSVVEQASFQVRGCVASIGCGSAVTELIVGRTLADAAAIGRERIVEAVGGLPEASQHAGHLAYEALQAALRGAAHQ